MVNMIRADGYRLLRSKLVHITLLVYVGFMVFLTLVVMDTGYEALVSMAPLAETVVLFLLPVIYAVAAVDFQYSTIKNTLSGGASRLKVYVAKGIVVVLFGTVMYVGAVILLVLAGTALYGFGKEITAELMITALQAIAIQMVLVMGAASIGISITFLTRSAVAFGSIYPIFFYLTDLILSTASAYFNNPYMKMPSFLANIRMTGIDSLTAMHAIQVLSVAAAYVALSTVLGVWFFRRSEIR